jgi:hypothetical protein
VPFAFNGNMNVAYPKYRVLHAVSIRQSADPSSAIRRMGRFARSRSENNFIVSLIP